MAEQEIIPPEKRPAPRHLQIGRFSVSRGAVTIIQWGAILGLLSWAGWSLQNFMSLRGIMNVLASRINLAFFAVSCFAAVWLVTIGFRRKKLWRILALVMLSVGVFALDWWAPIPIACSLAVDVGSTIMARVHLRAKWLPNGQTELYKPIFQDLFHEWVIKVVPNTDISSVVLSIRDARSPTDFVSVDPPVNATVSETKPGWVSGFDEPTQVPDFYSRTVVLSKLSGPVTIAIRKPIKSKSKVNTITSIDLDLDRDIHVSAEKCGIVMTGPPRSPTPLSDKSRFDNLMQELNTMLVETVAGKPGPGTRLDPDAAYPPLPVNESELVEELRCKTPVCSEMLVTMKEKTRTH